MRQLGQNFPFVCLRCQRAAQRVTRNGTAYTQRRGLASPPQEAGNETKDEGTATSADDVKGAMTRRLAEMSEEAITTGGRSARKAVEEAGFGEDLRKQLEDRLANAAFRSENAQAFASANLPASAGAGTRDVAGARPWIGTESTEDAALRMLNDAHKPMRGPPRTPSVRMPTRVDTGRKSATASTSGVRLANARDKSSVYNYLKDPNMSETEREQYRKELKERFAPAARSVPATLQGLASLANERIEDAIAAGKFKNLPRGKKIERDYNASSPFLDTTEYFMNKIIQRQDIVPPWIEKQQELVGTAARFRGRLRQEWKRHAARLIASKGGSLDGQIALAEEYALAEAVDNPPKTRTKLEIAIDEADHISEISLAGELKVAAQDDQAPAVEANTPVVLASSEQILDTTASQPSSAALTQDDTNPETSTILTEPAAAPPPPRRPTVPPFRDPSWLASEASYHALAISNLNSLARAYNLMAPVLARKPYYNLERELLACYADVAPQLADEIRQRARAPQPKIKPIPHKQGGVMARFGGGEKSKVYDEVRPQYGFKQFWRDLFAKEGS